MEEQGFYSGLSDFQTNTINHGDNWFLYFGEECGSSFFRGGYGKKDLVLGERSRKKGLFNERAPHF